MIKKFCSGYAQTSYNKEENIPVIGFDMGGTSTGMIFLSIRYYSGYLYKAFIN